MSRANIVKLALQSEKNVLVVSLDPDTFLRELKGEAARTIGLEEEGHKYSFDPHFLKIRPGSKHYPAHAVYVVTPGFILESFSGMVLLDFKKVERTEC